MTSIVIASMVSLWLLALSRVPRLLSKGHGRDDMFIAAFTAAIGATIAYSDIYELLDKWLDIVNISTVISGALIMFAFGLFRTCVVRAVVEPEAQASINRRGMKFTTAAVTAYVVSFLCAMLTGSTASTVRDAATASDIGVFIFSGTFCLFVAMVATNVVHVCIKYIPSMSSKLFRAGFILVMAGSFSGLLALGLMIIRQILVLLGARAELSTTFYGLYSAIGSAGCILFAAGLILPSVSGQIRHLDLPSRFRLLTLHPMWRRCAGTDSTTVLDHRSSPLASAFSRNPAQKLHRALVEVLDGHLVSRGKLLSAKELRQVRKTEERLYVHH